MNHISKLKYFQLTYLSNPSCDRQLFRAIAKNKIASIVEVGLRNIGRSENFVRVAQKFSGIEQIRYTGIDLFEGRDTPDSELTLKNVHQRMNALGAKVQLVPGDAYNALTRIANSHVRTDLIIVSAGYDPEALESAWKFVPRMLHATSKVLVQDFDNRESSYQDLSRLEIERRTSRNVGVGKSAKAA